MLAAGLKAEEERRKQEAEMAESDGMLTEPEEEYVVQFEPSLVNFPDIQNLFYNLLDLPREQHFSKTVNRNLLHPDVESVCTFYASRDIVHIDRSVSSFLVIRR